MADVQITCVTFRTVNKSHEAVSGVGSYNQRWTVAEVVQSIRAKTNTFFTKVNGVRAEVGVVESTTTTYLRTYADGKWNDNLLALPQCP